MAKRKRIRRRRSKRMFRQTASRSHFMNNPANRPVWMRGGIRL